MLSGPPAALQLLLILALGLLEPGCNSACETEATSETFSGGNVEEGIYASAPWTGPLAPFPGGHTIDFPHQLGVVPELAVSYVSFASEGVSGSNVSENAGDQGWIECVDSEVVRVRNHTCSDFYVRVVAIASSSGDASSEGCSKSP